jgi:DNA-binding transcriptional MerR regulator
MELYTTQQVAEQAGVTYRTLMRWIEQGLILPAVRGNRGQQTLLTKKGFREVAILAKLREFLSLQQLRQAIDDLRTQVHNPMSTGDFAVVRDLRGERSLLKICERGEVIELLETHPGQLRLFPMFDIEELITDTPPAETIIE